MPSALKAQAKDVFQRMSSVESQESDSICHGQSTTPKKQTLPKGLGQWGGGGAAVTNTHYLEGPQVKGCSSSTTFPENFPLARPPRLLLILSFDFIIFCLFFKLVPLTYVAAV